MKKNLGPATADERKSWDQLIANNPYPNEVYQTTTFAKIKAKQGWKPEYWVYETSFGVCYVLMLTRFAPGAGKVAYIPRGPSVVEPKQWSELCSLNRQFLDKVISIRMEPPIELRELKTLRDDIEKVGVIQKSVVNTIVIDLSIDEDALLNQMRQRARRSIRGGNREQLTVTEGLYSPTNVNHMWDLYKETAERAGIKTRPKTYFANFWRRHIDNDQGRFFFVWEPGDDKPIAGLFVSFVGDRALYKDGGSRRDTRSHFSHLLHWEVMRYLKSRGIRYYDLGGTPPSDKLDDPHQRLASLATFKVSFGVPVIDYIGAYDQILKPKAYKKWRKVEHVWRSLMWRLPGRDIF